MSRHTIRRPRSAAPARCVAPGAAALLATALLAGCTTTQERSAAMSSEASEAAQAKRFVVGRTNRDVAVDGVKRLEGEDGATAIVVRIRNRSGKAQALVPIGVDLWDARKGSLYSNRVDGLDPALNNVPVAPPGVSYWVNNQLPATRPARMQVRIGTARGEVPPSLPQLKIARVKLGEDAGVFTARGVVRNRSAVEQRKLTIFAVATKGDRIVAGGRAVVERLAAKGGRAQRFSIYFTGDPSGAKLHVFAPPSILGAA